jgi:hypothetical protein
VRSGVGEGTISRARRGEANVTIDNLDAIAKTYRLSAWQLLVPGLRADQPPQLAMADNSAQSSHEGIIDGRKKGDIGFHVPSAKITWRGTLAGGQPLRPAFPVLPRTAGLLIRLSRGGRHRCAHDSLNRSLLFHLGQK